MHRTKERRGTCFSSAEGGPDEVARPGGKEARVETVQRPAVGAEQTAGVLHPAVALEVGLEQVAERRGGAHREPQEQRVDPREPVLVERGALGAEDAEAEPADEALERLVGRDGGRERPAAEGAAGEVRARVTGEPADEDVGYHAAAVGQV